jgi:diguanylate cyclase
VGIRQVNPEITILGDLYLFNSIALLAALSAATASATRARKRVAVALAIFAWGFGSSISSWNALIGKDFPDFLSDLGYLAFYPFIFFGLISSLTPRSSTARNQILDSLITTLGLATIFSALTLELAIGEIDGSRYEVFLAIFYPIADLILVSTIFVILFKVGLSLRNLVILLGLITFAVTDFVFLIQSSIGTYKFGSYLDIGWLIGIILIAESLWLHEKETKSEKEGYPYATILAAIGSGAVIGIGALRPETFPSAVLIPAFITLTFAFLKMALSLIDANRLHEETHLARTDELTGLANRRKFMQELEVMSSGDLLLLLDLNGFKPINDSFGHEAGDRLLQQVADRLSRGIEKEALIARLGGDEFGVILRANQRTQEEIVGSIAAAFTYPFTLNKRGSVEISVAIGAVIADGRGELLRRADLAMYQAKRSGQRVIFWSPALESGSSVAPLNFQQTSRPLIGGN